MAKIRKAARGKRRWVGLTVPESFEGRDEFEAALGEIELLGDDWRLYDFKGGQAILRLPLEVYHEVKPTLEAGIEISGGVGDGGSIRSVTASGKIRLVRERMGIVRPPRKRKR